MACGDNHSMIISREVIPPSRRELEGKDLSSLHSFANYYNGKLYTYHIYGFGQNLFSQLGLGRAGLFKSPCLIPVNLFSPVPYSALSTYSKQNQSNQYTQQNTESYNISSYYPAKVYCKYDRTVLQFQLCEGKIDG